MRVTDASVTNFASANFASGQPTDEVTQTNNGNILSMG